jgi:hypothetical protein
MASCQIHPFDQADGSCRVCKREFCTTCLVYSFGPHKPPFCVPCALEAAGIRRGSRRGRQLTA